MNTLWYVENNVNPNDSIGIDEVGRGPLAGPVVAAAVWISDKGVALAEKDAPVINDSKKMTPKQREKTVEWAQNQSKDIIRYAVALASEEEIDSLNILNATMLAMQRAYKKLELHKPIVLVDGNKAPSLNGVSVRPVIKGDSKILSVAMASIIAKNYRDDLMKKLSEKYPQYGWETNAGYGSQKHIYAILRYGATPHHRKSFAPVKDLDNVSKEISKTLNLFAS